MAQYPKDQFDGIPTDLARVGAHRAPPRPGRGWIALAWAALATGVLVLGGIFGISLLNGSFQFEFPGATGEATPTATPTVAPTATPVTDPTTIDPARNITITVLNGTAVDGLQDVAGDALSAASWPVGSRATSTAKDTAETVVYYSDPLNEDVARGVTIALGVGTIQESTAFLGAPITVVLGADYSGN